MDDFDRYYAKALKFLGYRPRSEKEVVDNLTKKKAPNHITQLVISKLKEQRFINDDEFARMWIESRLRSKPQAIRIIKIELKRKGISEELIEKYLLREELNTSDDENAKRLVEKKIGKYKGMKRQEIYQKLGGFLGRRGFDWDTIRRAIDSHIDL